MYTIKNVNMEFNHSKMKDSNWSAEFPFQLFNHRVDILDYERLVQIYIGPILISMH